MERFVWIGPFRQPGAGGDLARAWARTLLAAGAGVAAVDPDPAPDAAPPPPPWLAPLFDGPAIVRGATCVWQGSPEALRRASDLFPANAAARRVACTSVPGETAADDAGTLSGFDEVWVRSHLERERLSAAEVPRAGIRVLAPGFDVDAFAAPAPAAGTGWTAVAILDPADAGGAARIAEAWTAAFRRGDAVELILAVPEGDGIASARAALARDLAGVVDWLDPERAPMSVRAIPAAEHERAALWRTAAVLAFPGRADASDLLREAAAAGIPRLVLDWAGTAEQVGGDTATVLSGDVESWTSALRRAFDDPAAAAPGAVRAAASTRATDTFTARGLEALQRAARPARPDARILERVLPEVGLRTPRELVDGCRSRIVVSVFKPGEDSWREPFRRHLRSHGPSDDVTFCLWADAQSTDGLEVLAAAINAETDAHAGPSGPPDLQLLVAPADHVPWDRVEPAGGASAREGAARESAARA